MTKTKVKTAKLEGEALLERLGYEAFSRCVTPYKAKSQSAQEGSTHCGMRFQEEVFIGRLSWETVSNAHQLKLEVFSINPQTGELDLRLDHTFQEGLS